MSDCEKRASGFTDVDDNYENEKGEAEQLNTPINQNKKQKKISTKFHFDFNEIICIANILATALGIGVFTFPYILYKIGVINSLFVFIFLFLSVYYSLELLRRFVVDAKLFSYASITQATLGNCWLKIYAIFTFFFYMSTIINYLKIISNLATSMMDFLTNKIVKIFYFLITYVLEVILCLYTSNISKIHILSFIGFATFIIIFFTVVIKGIYHLSTNNDRFKYFSFFSFKEENNGWNIFLTLMAKIIEFYYGYIYHSTFPTLLSGLKNLNEENTKRINDTSYIIISVFYFFFSFFGFFCINEHNETYTELFVGENDYDLQKNTAIICIFKFILILFFVSLIPVRYLVIRDNYISLIGHDNLPFKFEIIITLICLFITNTIVYFADYDNLISNLIIIFGGFFGVFIGFVLPVINYIAINGKTKCRSIFGYIIAGIFVLIGFFSIFYNFKNMNKKEEKKE